MAKPERCSKCGALIALVGRVHRCEPPAPGRRYTEQEKRSPVVLVEALQRKIASVARKPARKVGRK